MGGVRRGARYPRNNGGEATVAPVQRGLFEDARSAGPACEDTREKDSVRSPAAEPGHDEGRASEVLVVDARGPWRAGGARFGELVHATLAIVPLSADRATIDALASVQGRILAATDEEIRAAIETVERVVAHELLRRARSAEARGACRREAPVTITLKDGTVLEGVVDLAFEEAGVWTVVDYKTDREIESSGDARYRRQVGLYASAIALASGQPATAVLIRV